MNPPPIPTEAPPPPAPSKWQGILLRVCLIVFTIEVGAVLILLPWTRNWDQNYFRDWLPLSKSYWMEPSFRGAITGLGLVNLYIALLQVIRLFRRK